MTRPRHLSPLSRIPTGLLLFGAAGAGLVVAVLEAILRS